MSYIITAAVSFIAGAISYRLFWPKAKAAIEADLTKA
jgi:hypothetical protein